MTVIIPHNIKMQIIDESINELNRWNFKTVYEKIKHIEDFPATLLKRITMLKDEYQNLDYPREGSAFAFLPGRVVVLEQSMINWKKHLMKEKT